MTVNNLTFHLIPVSYTHLDVYKRQVSDTVRSRALARSAISLSVTCASEVSSGSVMIGLQGTPQLPFLSPRPSLGH